MYYEVGGCIRALSSLAQSEIVKTQTQALFPYLIEITTPDGTVYRYANTDSDIVYTDKGVVKTFSSAYFKITPPEITESGVKDAKITMSAVDQTWIVRIRENSERSIIRFLAVIQYDDADGTQYIEPIDDITMKLTSVSWNENTIQWTMKFDDWLDIKMPIQTFSQFVCPALF